VSAETPGRRVPKNACPSCVGWASDARGRIERFLLAGVTHFAPAGWVMGRVQRREHEGLGGVDAYFVALGDWAAHCALERERVSA
jgi:hypothetical protein